MQDEARRGAALLKIPRHWVIGAGITLLIVVSGKVYSLQGQRSEQAKQIATTPLIIQTVTALGRLEPQGEVIQVGASTSTQENRISQLLVNKGDHVEAGQIIAILDSRDRLQATLDQMQKDRQVAQARLAQVEAGAKPGEVRAQQAEIARLEANQSASIMAQQSAVERLAAEAQNAQIEAQRYRTLYQQGAISASQQDSKQLILETAQPSLQQAQAELTRLQSTQLPELDRARATLSQISEVRSVDVAVLQAELDRAISAVRQAEANLEQSYVRAPQNGFVLDIYTRAGEVISNHGILEIGQIDQMYAIAEIYQSDIQKIRIGQSVRVTSEALPNVLRGIVDQIDRKVRQQTVINTDPSANIDARVIEVYVRLDKPSSQIAENFTNLQVQVEIGL
jgi:HlyD family secretion protein